MVKSLSLRSPCHWIIAAPLIITDEQALWAWLSAEEQTRADRFRRQEDRQRHILAHSLKRYCLSQLLNLSPESLQFTVGEKGKPYCNHPSAPDFNIAHGGQWVLLGLSHGGAIGVDVEPVAREVSDSVANYALSPSQIKQVQNSENPQTLLMQFWTQKEAISKALGLGLSLGFNTIDCSGQLGVSHSQQENQSLHIETRLTDDEYLVSVASTDSKPIDFYKLNQWNGRTISVTKWD